MYPASASRHHGPSIDQCHLSSPPIPSTYPKWPPSLQSCSPAGHSPFGSWIILSQTQSWSCHLSLSSSWLPAISLQKALSWSSCCESAPQPLEPCAHPSDSPSQPHMCCIPRVCLLVWLPPRDGKHLIKTRRYWVFRIPRSRDRACWVS